MAGGWSSVTSMPLEQAGLFYIANTWWLCHLVYQAVYRLPLLEPMNLKDHFTILRKCRSNLDCLRYESHTSDILKPVVNTQSCRAKLFFNEHFISLKVFCHLIRLIVDPFTMQILSYYLIVNDIRR